MKNLFEIDYLQKMGILLREAFQFKKYKAMPIVIAILSGIVMIPLVLLSFFLVALFSLVAFVFSVVLLPVKAIHGIVQNEGKNTMHAPQFIIYFISWTIIFVLYMVLALLVPVIFVLYAALSVTTYIWSFCGFRFHLFPTEENISVDVNGTYMILPLIYACIGWILFIIPPTIRGAFLFADLYKHYREAEFLHYLLLYILPKSICFQNLFSTLFALIGFSKLPKKRDFEKYEKEEREEYVEEIPVFDAPQDPSN